ncbi:MAG: Rpn family recombination-promoting nuclease/putative transposase, partial [Clostridiales bacterium]|nr:Rpn family recombination-promoting nuclease/putative transposase [Clostridiales bacterium]
MKKNNDAFIMLPTVDFCFKELMNNPKIRKGFVAAVMGIRPEEIQETRLLPTELSRHTPDEKLGILDVLVLMQNGTRINMEMQVRYFASWSERVLYYLSNVFCSQLAEGEPYERMQKCIHVSILDFIHFPEDEECYRKIHFRDDKTGKIYSDKMEIQILELKKLPGELVSGEDIIAWMRFFSSRSREDFERMAKTNEYFEEA